MKDNNTEIELQINPEQQFAFILTNHESRLDQHRAWLSRIKRERPSTIRPYKVGVYIRYYNQTKHNDEDYLELHKKQYADSISQCPQWSLVDFYVDKGLVAPLMESSPEWNRLLDDCMEGKVDLILTQKVSNVSSNTDELIICARLLAALPCPVGIYFISEDIFTLASYYQTDLHDPEFLLSSQRSQVSLPEESND